MRESHSNWRRFGKPPHEATPRFFGNAVIVIVVVRLPVKQTPVWDSRWFKSGLRNHKLFCPNKFRAPCNHPN